MRLTRFAVWTVVSLLAGTLGAHAAGYTDTESHILADKWYFSLGSSAASFNTEASIGFGSVFGTFIRIEDDLDLEGNKSSFRFNGIWAFKPKHALDVTFTDFSREGEVLIDKEFTIGDNGEEITFEVGADVATKFDSTNAKIFYKYSFVNTGKSQAGIGAGLSFFDYAITFDGVARLGNGMTEFRRVDEKFLAPIPSFLMFIHQAFTPRLVLRATAGFFSLDFSDIEGSLIETRFTLDYFITKHFGIGGGAEASRIEYKDHGEDPLSVDVDTRGLIFYVAGAF